MSFKTWWNAQQKASKVIIYVFSGAVLLFVLITAGSCILGGDAAEDAPAPTAVEEATE